MLDGCVYVTGGVTTSHLPIFPPIHLTSLCKAMATCTLLLFRFANRSTDFGYLSDCGYVDPSAEDEMLACNVRYL